MAYISIVTSEGAYKGVSVESSPFDGCQYSAIFNRQKNGSSDKADIDFAEAVIFTLKKNTPVFLFSSSVDEFIDSNFIKFKFMNIEKFGGIAVITRRTIKNEIEYLNHLKQEGLIK